MTLAVATVAQSELGELLLGVPVDSVVERSLGGTHSSAAAGRVLLLQPGPGVRQPVESLARSVEPEAARLALVPHQLPAVEPLIDAGICRLLGAFSLLRTHVSLLSVPKLSRRAHRARIAPSVTT